MSSKNTTVAIPKTYMKRMQEIHKKLGFATATGLLRDMIKTRLPYYERKAAKIPDEEPTETQ
jgi:hypothetical protein